MSVDRWEVEVKNDQVLIYETDHAETVAEVLTNESDAMLMAASPQLLAALQDVIAFLDQMTVGAGTLEITPAAFGAWTARALDAIAKAKGAQQ